MRKNIFEKGKKWPYNRKTSRPFKFGDECSFSKHDIVKTKYTPVSRSHWNNEKIK